MRRRGASGAEPLGSGSRHDAGARVSDGSRVEHDRSGETRTSPECLVDELSHGGGAIGVRERRPGVRERVRPLSRR
jgi:hypothetical protein